MNYWTWKLISFDYLKLVKGCIADWRKSYAHLYHQVPHFHYNFLVPTLNTFTTSPRPITSTNDSLVLLFFLRRGYSLSSPISSYIVFLYDYVLFAWLFCCSTWQCSDLSSPNYSWKKFDVCIPWVTLHLVCDNSLCRLPSDIVDILFRIYTEW